MKTYTPPDITGIKAMSLAGNRAEYDALPGLNQTLAKVLKKLNVVNQII